jgi:transcriptional regulator with XRE-family HTH domain
MEAQVVALANRVRELREAVVPRLSQEELSRLVGVNKSYIAALEGGRIQLPAPAVVRRLAEALSTTTLDLLIASGYLERGDVDPVALVLDDPAYALALREMLAG